MESLVSPFSAAIAVQIWGLNCLSDAPLNSAHHSDQEPTTQRPSSGLDLPSESQRAIAKAARYAARYPLGSFWHLQPLQGYRELFTPSDIYYIKLLKCFDCSAVLVQCHVSGTARAGLSQLTLTASFSEPQFPAGNQTLSHKVGHYAEAERGPASSALRATTPFLG